MKKELYKPIILGKSLPSIELPAAARKFDQLKAVIPPIDSKKALKDFKKIAASMDVPDKFPDILEPPTPPTMIASFTASGKTGSAIYLDIWDCDHFDYFTDMGRNLAENRVWFSGDGYNQWGSGQTKTGVINCYFQTPETRRYRCDATLQSVGGPAVVECSLDTIPFGFLNVNGTITQPHARDLNAGFHAFRIRQVSGSFFFLSLTVYAI